MNQEIRIPSEQDAKKILHQSMGLETKTINRFTTGAANYVYDVVTTDGQSLVVRMARSDLAHYIEGALYWHERLLDKSVPLAKLYAGDATATLGFPYMIIERFPGEDLAHVYTSLTTDQKQTLASRLVEIQHNVSSLPQAKGFGFAHSYEQPGWHRNWEDVVQSSLQRSRQRIQQAGIVDPQIVEKVSVKIPSMQSYFNTVQPKAFLDDTTTKNVIIHNGSLSGIVDTDMVCFGDKLFTVGLTRMSLLARKYDTQYTDSWAEQLHLTQPQRDGLDFYTMLFCVDFLAEQGFAFNKDAVTVDHQYVQHLLTALLQLTS